MMTNLEKLRAIAKWLGDDHELPSSGDAACVSDAADEIEKLRVLLKDARRVLDDWCDEYGHVELERMRDRIDAAFPGGDS